MGTNKRDMVARVRAVGFKCDAWALKAVVMMGGGLLDHLVCVRVVCIRGCVAYAWGALGVDVHHTWIDLRVSTDMASSAASRSAASLSLNRADATDPRKPVGFLG